MFDAALCLGICDKIVPGLLIGALQFGHLPVIFVPGGPMPSGLSNDEKAQRAPALRARARSAATRCSTRKRSRTTAPGTCTFYGTANSNQMLMEVMGLHLPGRRLRQPEHAAARCADRGGGDGARSRSAASAREYTPIGKVVDERAIVNGIVGLLATGGSTNHTIHLVAIARAAGIVIDWDDFSDLSDVVPLLARIYPNGKADVNHFHAAGGMGFVIARAARCRAAARRRDHGGRRRRAAALRQRAVPGRRQARLARRAARERRPRACCAARRSRSAPTAA